MEKKKRDIQQLIGNTLRWGVSIASAIACVGGVIHLWRHGMEPMPDFTHFAYEEAHPENYTTLAGIWNGLWEWTARSWMQLGVLALILTPIMRVVLSLFDFLQERDWLYATITAIVLAVILINSVGGY